jgi:hypothetical protein
MQENLIQQRTKELDILAWCGQLKLVQFDDYYAFRLLTGAVQSIHIARTQKISQVDRFDHAYAGMYALFCGCLYLHGLVPTVKVGHKELVVQLACEIIDMNINDRDTLTLVSRYFDDIFKKGSDLIGTPQIDDMLALADCAITLARAKFPSWFDYL